MINILFFYNGKFAFDFDLISMNFRSFFFKSIFNIFIIFISIFSICFSLFVIKSAIILLTLLMRFIFWFCNLNVCFKFFRKSFESPSKRSTKRYYIDLSEYDENRSRWVVSDYWLLTISVIEVSSSLCQVFSYFRSFFYVRFSHHYFCLYVKFFRIFIKINQFIFCEEKTVL